MDGGAMRRVIVAVAVIVSCLSIGFVELRGAGSNATEEAAIRKIIAAENEGHPVPHTADQIFWSGPYQRPVIWPEKPTPASTAIAPIEARVPGGSRGTKVPVRIVVADSRDLAYEYETTALNIRMKDGTTRNAESAALRVWQKEAGEWKIAAEFSAPHRK
jgi:hypothetical protein